MTRREFRPALIAAIVVALGAMLIVGYRLGQQRPSKVQRPVKVQASRRTADPGTDMTFPHDCDEGPRTTLAFLGDMKLHKPLAEQALKRGHESLWRGAKDLVAAADVTWANLEGALSCCVDIDEAEHPDPGDVVDGVVYSATSKAGLNFHPSFAAALKGAGIDVLSTANNHALDRGAIGAKKTLDVLDGAGLKHTGSRRSADEPWYTMTQERGFTFAWLACAEWTNVKRANAKPFVLNCTEQRAEVMRLISELAHRDGVDGVIFLPHGGEEERLLPDDRLRKLAVDAAEAGALAVFTSHPHNMQTWEKYTTKDGRDVPLSWGRGNYITFAAGIENIVSTIVYMGVVRGADGKAYVSGIVHVPLWLSGDSGDRTLLAIDREPLASEDVRQMVLTRFGNSRLHPPTIPIDTQRFCPSHGPLVKSSPRPPARARVGDVCANDDVCDGALSCMPTADGNGVCTASCKGDAAGGGQCPAASNSGGVCGADGMCRRPCSVDDDCTLATHCVSKSYCAPLSSHSK